MLRVALLYLHDRLCGRITPQAALLSTFEALQGPVRRDRRQPSGDTDHADRSDAASMAPSPTGPISWPRHRRRRRTTCSSYLCLHRRTFSRPSGSVAIAMIFLVVLASAAICCASARHADLARHVSVSGCTPARAQRQLSRPQLGQLLPELRRHGDDAAGSAALQVVGRLVGVEIAPALEGAPRRRAARGSARSSGSAGSRACRPPWCLRRCRRAAGAPARGP